MEHRAESKTRSVAGPKVRHLRMRIGIVLWAMLLGSSLFFGFRWNHLRRREAAFQYLKSRNAIMEFRPPAKGGEWLGISRLIGEDSLGQLRSIDLSQSAASDSDLAHVAAFVEIVELDLSDSNVTNASSNYLGRLRNLEHLDLSRTQINDDVIAGIAHNNLTSLDISHTSVTDVGIESIANWKSLTSLSAQAIPASDGGLMRLSRLPNLVICDLSQTAAAGESLRTFGLHSRLREIKLTGCPISDDHLESLSKCATLESLYLDETEVGDVGISRLAACNALQKLILHSTRATDRSLQALRPLPNLMLIGAENTEISPAALEQFKQRQTNQRKPTPPSYSGLGATSAIMR
jgi:Leucine-rich repeat (LRR) protein